MRVHAPTALAAVIALTCAGRAAPAQEQQKASPPCGGEEIARGSVSRVVDGRTVVLDDGREVRLFGIEVPLPASARQSDAPPGDAESKAALDALLGGDAVVLRRAPEASDRYGRTLAYAYAVRDGEEIFAQGEMLAAGYARVGDRAGPRACAAELLAREAAARAARLGLWAEPYYEVLNAETPADVLARQGRFALVEGKVVSVRESGSTIYVNFGRHWSEGFTVTILKRNERNFTTAGLDVKGLEGRRVRVRGWVEERGGARSGTGGGAGGGTGGSTGGSPWIEAVRPEQIEIAGTE